MEHRWGTRHLVRWPAELEIGGRRVPGILTDVSLSGAYVRTPHRIDAPALARVTVRPGCGAVLTSDRPALVVRADADGLGLEWLSDGFDGFVPLQVAVSRLDRLGASVPAPLEDVLRAGIRVSRSSSMPGDR